MPTLSSDLRNQLERTVIAARDAAEEGARAALEALAVHHHEPYGHMSPEDRDLRNHLRARARQLGDRQDKSGWLVIDHLVSECAYEHWHRMLFARFLAENDLLIEPEMEVAISLEEAEDLAKEEGLDVWTFASRCAQQMLPQIFRPDDPLLQITYASEYRLALEKLLECLAAGIFTASDALGWVYQFWQSKRKDEVNASEVKIGAHEIPVVTQLFTEPYMVEFLLHNTLGAWWAGKQLTEEDLANAETEDELRKKVALPGLDWTYLRFIKEDTEGGSGNWRPAAGTFEEWPKIVAEVRVLDPCCGSGHFLVAALRHIAPMRMMEEGLSEIEAIDAALCENLYGLEIDERCCQITPFALALAAWTQPGSSGYRDLPELNIACTGVSPRSTLDQWVKLVEESSVLLPAEGLEPIKNGLRNLHRLFSQAPTLGSLINPAKLPADLVAADYETVRPFLGAAMSSESKDYDAIERAVAAAGMVKAAELLAGEFTLVITNVPYLGRGLQGAGLRSFADSNMPEAKADLATMMLVRSLQMLSKYGTLALVLPQTCLFLKAYARLRQNLLERQTWDAVAKLGPGAFEGIGGHVVNVALVAISSCPPGPGSAFAAIDANHAPTPQTKAEALRTAKVSRVEQSGQVVGTCVIRLSEVDEKRLLGAYARAWQGLVTGDDNRFLRCFWEVSWLPDVWSPIQRPPDRTEHFTGRSQLLRWDSGVGDLHRDSKAHNFPPPSVLGTRGVAVQRMSGLHATLYEGEIFNDAVAPLIPADEDNLPAIWSFAQSEEFETAVREVNQKVNVTPGSFHEVEFDLTRWRTVAAEVYPDGLPSPGSDDPAQWLFHGQPYETEEEKVLQVAVSRLLGYCWPAELDSEMHVSERVRRLADECEGLQELADDDGIVCIPSVRGEDPASDQLMKLLAACDIEPEVDLDDWLRNEFFQEHCELFHHRPFIWHVWDGRKRDGFHALVNYHKLVEGDGKGRRLLESLTYAYLGDWISRCQDEVRRGEGGAEDRLAAATALKERLEVILNGEPPFDLFVRWKPLAEQPIGWDPDINDGVRLNIRPFMASDIPGGRKGAGILRYKPNIKWGKDRGKEPVREKDEYPWFWGWNGEAEDFMGGEEFDGNRWNDLHYSNEVKQAARMTAEEGKT